MSYLNNKLIIHREDNFLEKENCNYLINIFNKSNPSVYRDTFILDYVDQNILDKVSHEFNTYNLKNPDKMELTKWPVNSKMDLHHDVGDRLAFLIYLNDNFEGGETIIDGITIKPKTGRLVLFSNGVYKHQVKKINNGTRYTLIAWYK